MFPAQSVVPAGIRGNSGGASLLPMSTDGVYEIVVNCGKPGRICTHELVQLANGIGASDRLVAIRRKILAQQGYL